MTDKGHFTIRSIRWTDSGAAAEDRRDLHDAPKVPDLDLRSAKRPPTQSGEFLVVPIRRRSADNIAAVRPSIVDLEGSGTKLSTPPNGPDLELDSTGPISSAQSPAMTGGVELEELHWLSSRPPAANSAETTPTIPKVQYAPPSRPRAPVGVRVVDRRVALAQLAGFGAPPTSVFGTPAYALRVLVRRRVLAGNLERARRYHTHDATVFEEALSSANDSAVSTGLALLLTLAALLAGAA